jgi:hypothetical protein
MMMEQCGMEWLFDGLGTAIISLIIGGILAKTLIQIKIPYVDYFNRWKANKFIKTYTSLCQFNEFGKFKWPPADFSLMSQEIWFNNIQYEITGNKIFEGIGSNVFSQTNQKFLIKQFANEKEKKREIRKQSKIWRFWNNKATFFDKITNTVKFKSDEKQQILVIYQSDDNYVRILDSAKNESISYSGERSLLFVFYLKDQTEIYRINNAEIFQGEPGGPPMDNKITYFYVDKAKLERI